MGLGALLFSSETAASQLRGNGALPKTQSPPQNGTGSTGAVNSHVNTTTANEPDPPTGSIAGFQVTEKADDAKFAMLWPALGCPQILEPENPALEIIFYCKDEVAAITEDYVLKMLNHILVMEWDQARDPYNKEGGVWNLNNIKKTTLRNLMAPGGKIIFCSRPMSLQKYKDKIKQQPIKFGNLLHSTAEVVPKAYLDEGFKSVATIKIYLQMKSGDDFELKPGKMFNLFYGPENGLIPKLLSNSAMSNKPYDNIPLLDYKGNVLHGLNQLIYRWRHEATDAPPKSRCGERKREHKVRLFHPFGIARSGSDKYLNVGHLTDMHISSLWDYFDEKIFKDYNVDQTEIKDLTGRDPSRRDNVDREFELIAHRYNNPNMNVRNLTYLFNDRKKEGLGIKDKYVDLILQTGDLIDFNRGFNMNPRHDPEKDYYYNLNWLRYYELLLLDYKRPTFTVLGNHEYRLNPYPARIKAEGVHLWLLVYVILMTTAAGAVCGSTFGALEEALDDTTGEAVGKFLLQVFILPFLMPLVGGVLFLLLAGFGLDIDIAWDILIGKFGWMLLGGWVIGYLIIWFLLLIKVIDSNQIENTEDGAKYGSIIGASMGGIIFIVALFLIFKERDYMSHVANLYGEDFGKLLDNNGVAWLNAFGKDGIFYMSQKSVEWYSFVINPFPDYAFQYGNVLFMMANWDGSEILTADPPVADDVFSKHQWKLLIDWIQLAINHRETVGDDEAVQSILGMHTPVFCPMLDVDLEKANLGMDADDGDIARGTMEEHRDKLIERLFKLSQGELSNKKKISAISLTGHTHDYDIFLMGEADKTNWYQLEDFRKNPAIFKDKAIHITTSSAGPPSDGHNPKGKDEEKTKDLLPEIKAILKTYEDRFDNNYDKPKPEHKDKIKYEKGKRVPRPAGARVITFDKTNGSLKNIEEISSKVSRWGDKYE